MDLDFGGLTCLLNGLNTGVSDGAGRLLIVEDLTKDVIEVLGSSLDIDPLFFASQIYGPNVDITSSKPSMATLPSKAMSRNFLSLQYQRSFEFENCPVAPGKMSRDSNVPRKVVMLPPTKNVHIGLAQHGCSVLLTKARGNGWLGEIGTE